MPKPMFVWSGTAWVSVASEVESLAGFATQSYADNTPGARLVVPTSVAVGSGSGSVGTSGVVTFSGASSISLNGCFTSAYDNYRIVISNLIGSTTATGVTFRLRKSGTDNSSNIYWRQYTRGAGTTAELARVQSTSFGLLNVDSTGTNMAVLDIALPFVSTSKTSMLGISMGNPTNDLIIWNNAYSHDLATSADFDGFSLIAASGTMSGTIRVYGMKN